MLAKRIITAVVLAPLMAAGIFLLPLNYFAIFIAAIVLLGAWEWANLAGLTSIVSRLGYTLAVAVVIAAVYYLQCLFTDTGIVILWLAAVWWLLAFFLIIQYPNLVNLWNSTSVQSVMGLFVLLPMWVGFYQLKEMPQSSQWIILLMVFIWGADVGAYGFGKMFGRRKLAPNVSPGKSWEGAIGGMFTVICIAIGAGFYLSGQLPENEIFETSAWVNLIVISMLVVVVSVVGDLLESMLKRNRGIKDSSQLLPGHGGVLDRADSMCSAVPIYALALIYLPIS